MPNAANEPRVKGASPLRVGRALRAESICLLDIDIFRFRESVP